MTTITQQLADALRSVSVALACAGDMQTMRAAVAAGVADALAAYDAQASRLPTEYRVTTEWDAFDAHTPREAAIEVWEKIRNSTGPVFTVYGRDGSVTDVDLEGDA